jgi:hypothetical protein
MHAMTSDTQLPMLNIDMDVHNMVPLDCFHLQTHLSLNAATNAALPFWRLNNSL